MPGTLTRWDPFTEFADLRTRFDRMLGELAVGREREWMPAIDVLRDENKWVMRANIPGIQPEEVQIVVKDDMLTVSGEHEERMEDTGKDYVRRERHFGSFTRTVSLPPGCDAGQIQAHTHDGVLEVTIPLPMTAGRPPVQITPTAA